MLAFAWTPPPPPFRLMLLMESPLEKFSNTQQQPRNKKNLQTLYVLAYVASILPFLILILDYNSSGVNPVLVYHTDGDIGCYIPPITIRKKKNQTNLPSNIIILFIFHKTEHFKYNWSNITSTPFISTL